ncbi:cyclic nucleotide-gated ion channel 1-like [Hibiscus syriacus]|uniref:Cyclic nucleotide-gated ion channel 1-like n=1 Tax=Hibiscus syriacus TaxID=106335 RepID=A0A6A3CVZ2_HIBSY|nr:cyclic nucleotide-gated ion channel 1-like [Hibiscus syriacus]
MLSTQASHEPKTEQNSQTADCPLADSGSVQNLIERCLQLYMNRDEVVKTLLTRAWIEPGFTTLGSSGPNTKWGSSHACAVNNLPMGYPVLQQPPIPATGQPHIDSMGISSCHVVNGIPAPSNFQPMQMSSGNDMVMDNNESDVTPAIPPPTAISSISEMPVSSTSMASSGSFPFTASDMLGMGVDTSALDSAFTRDVASSVGLLLGNDNGAGNSRDSFRSLDQIQWNFSLTDLTADLSNLGDLGALGNYPGSPFLHSDSEILLDSSEHDNIVSSPSLTLYGEIRPHLRRFPSPSPAKSLTTIHSQKSLIIIQKWKINLRGNKVSLATTIASKLSPAQRKLFEETCFGPWLRVQHPGGDANLTHLWLQTMTSDLPDSIQRGEEEIWFHFPPAYTCFGRKEFCLITSLRFGHDDVGRYTRHITRPSWLSRVFPDESIEKPNLHVDDMKKLFNKKEGFTRMNDVDVVREANIPLMRLTPTEVELVTDWWQASQRFLDGTNDEQPPLPPLRKSSPHPEPSPDRPDYTPLQREPSPIPSHHRASSPPSPHDRRPAKMPRLLSPCSPPPRDESRELRDEVNALREEIGTLRDNDGAWRVEVSTLRGEVAALREMVVSLQNEVHTLRNERTDKVDALRRVFLARQSSRIRRRARAIKSPYTPIVRRNRKKKPDSPVIPQESTPIIEEAPIIPRESPPTVQEATVNVEEVPPTIQEPDSHGVICRILEKPSDVPDMEKPSPLQIPEGY